MVLLKIHQLLKKIFKRFNITNVPSKINLIQYLNKYNIKTKEIPLTTVKSLAADFN